MDQPDCKTLRHPRLDELGLDLLKTSAIQRYVAISRPLIGICAYAIAAFFKLWWLLPLIVFLIFIAVVTVTHDLVHGALGLNRRRTEWGLFVMGAILLESGHSYRATHRQHHRVFPAENDPEGDPARMSLIGAILNGPLFLPRLWIWAFRQNRNNRSYRIWLGIEAAIPVLVIILGVLAWKQTPAILLYAVLMIAGSWVYPLLTVHLPHRNYGATPLEQTHTLRGRIIPALFLELTYHLEHHLYPQVPSHNLPELSRRLEPFFRDAGVSVTHVP